jgi:tetratricopeptide (TPR) repeat protein
MTKDLKSLRSKIATIHQDGRLAEVLPLYAQYLAHRPDDATMWSNLGVLHRAEKRHEQAIRAHQRAIALRDDSPTILVNFANLLSDIGRYDESIVLREKVLALRPGDLDQKSMIGRCLRGKGDYKAAIAYLSQQQIEHPDEAEIRLQLAFAQLGDGAYADGFESYQSRWQASELEPRDLDFPEWQGEPLEGKSILVLPEQGFGDAILFARFVKMLKAMGAQVYYIAKKPVARIFEGLEGADWVGSKLPPDVTVDYWINNMDVALLHFASDTTVPAPVTLHVPQDAKDRAARITAPYNAMPVKKIGVVWTGSMTYKGNAFRSFSHTDFLPLTDVPGVQLFSLYKGPALDAFVADGSSAFIVNAGATERDFADCAAMMQEMDLVITSDTATAHVAGSLGVPTWTVLHWDAFWVWRHSGDTTEWYPNMRLFRQHAPLKWDGVMQDITRELHVWTESTQ